MVMICVNVVGRCDFSGGRLRNIRTVLALASLVHFSYISFHIPSNPCYQVSLGSCLVSRCPRFHCLGVLFADLLDTKHVTLFLSGVNLGRL